MTRIVPVLRRMVLPEVWCKLMRGYPWAGVRVFLPTALPSKKVGGYGAASHCGRPVHMQPNVKQTVVELEADGLHTHTRTRTRTHAHTHTHTPTHTHTLCNSVMVTVLSNFTEHMPSSPKVSTFLTRSIAS